MTLAVLAVLGSLLALVFALVRARKNTAGAPARDTTVALDTWLREALELELAEHVLGIKRSTTEERRKLARTLANEPDPDLVGAIEETVRAVELEFVRYAHEPDVETTVRVRYEDGTTGAASRRLTLADVPETVRSDFKSKGATSVFRTWSFPWQRLHIL